MRRALSVAVLAATVVSLGACEDDTPKACGAAEGTSATCDQACAKLAELDCRIASTAAECVATCETSSASVAAAVTGRVRACYAQATSCSEVDGCSLTCGPGGGPVPFPGVDAAALDGSVPLDAGEGTDAGEGMDAGSSPGDAGIADDAGSDAGVADDAGSAGSDAGSPALDGG